MARKVKTKTIKVKWMREARSGLSIRVRYMGKMPWIPKFALVNFDEQFWYYNESLEITVKEGFLRKLHKELGVTNTAWGW